MGPTCRRPTHRDGTDDAAVARTEVVEGAWSVTGTKVPAQHTIVRSTQGRSGCTIECRFCSVEALS